jgi:cytochrome c oxidase assembly protein Cox11
MAYKNKGFMIQLASILIAVNVISCTNTGLSGTTWKYIESATNADSLFRNRNIEIKFVNTNKILLHDECNESVFEYVAKKNGNLRIDSYHLTKDCENTTTGMNIHSNLMYVFSEAGKFNLKGDTLLIYSRAQKGLDIYTFVKK